MTLINVTQWKIPAIRAFLKMNSHWRLKVYGDDVFVVMASGDRP